MKSSALYIITIILGLTLIQACGPDESEVERDQQAIQDSLEQAYEAEMEQMRQDSIQQAQADSAAAAEEEEENQQQNDIEYSDDGDFVVQIEAWRSEEKARQQADEWEERGYEQAYVVSYGNEDTGDIWYRVRIGQFDTREMAERFQNMLEEEYNTSTWIGLEGEPVEGEAMRE